MIDKRERLKKLGIETVNIVAKGYYQNDKGEEVNIQESVDNMNKGTILYNPQDGARLVGKQSKESVFETEFEVKNETTLNACKRLIEEGFEKMAALNFASAKRPGGGFLDGSAAQEESLARSSALFDSISKKTEMYAKNKSHRSCLYTDHMIYSPNVPVFREDGGRLLDEPFLVSFITAPAINRGEVLKKEKHISQSQMDLEMKRRIEKILAVALEHEHEAIVLGAFGCGVFRNSPKAVAAYFKEILTRNDRFKGKFKKVTFAVLDYSDQKLTLSAFTDTFRTK